MKDPFKRFGNYNPSQYSGPISSNKLIIVAGIVTFGQMIGNEVAAAATATK
jgi:hypothetical protein